MDGATIGKEIESGIVILMTNIFNIIKKTKADPVVITKRSNIIQFDDMGYPLQLCIMSDGSQRWFDVSEEYAKNGLESGSFKVLEWGR